MGKRLVEGVVDHARLIVHEGEICTPPKTEPPGFGFSSGAIKGDGGELKGSSIEWGRDLLRGVVDHAGSIVQGGGSAPQPKPSCWGSVLDGWRLTPPGIDLGSPRGKDYDVISFFFCII